MNCQYCPYRFNCANTKPDCYMPKFVPWVPYPYVPQYPYPFPYYTIYTYTTGGELSIS